MKCFVATFSVLMIAASAFSPSASHRRSFATPLQAVNKEMAFLQDQASKVMAVAVLTASLWSAPAIPFLDHLPTNTAVAKEMASGSGSRVNKDPESLLRLGLPIDNKEVCFCRYPFHVIFLLFVLFAVVEANTICADSN